MNTFSQTKVKDILIILELFLITSRVPSNSVYHPAVQLRRNADQQATRKRWNQALSHIQIEVEHAFGRVKGHFRALQCLPGRDIAEMKRIIESLFTLQNILLDYGDHGDDMEAEGDDDGLEIEANDEAWILRRMDTRMVVLRRLIQPQRLSLLSLPGRCNKCSIIQQLDLCQLLYRLS